jgi:FkbM family methyltransferase
MIWSLLGKILRLPLSLIPPETEVRILRGPLRLKKWIKGAGPNACWVGTYEVARVRAFADAITHGAVVYDIGANVGIYSLVAGSMVGVSGRVYAFEPLDRNVRYLRRHIMLNNLLNCTVIEVAIGNQDGTRRFSAAAWESSMARLSPEGELSVLSATLDTCIYRERHLRPPDIMKIDVEGAEFEVLQGATNALSEFHPTVFLEIHGTQLHAECRAFLLAKGYTVEDKYGHLTATWRTRTTQH